jgi:hypothetical protein
MLSKVASERIDLLFTAAATIVTITLGLGAMFLIVFPF